MRAFILIIIAVLAPLSSVASPVGPSNAELSRALVTHGRLVSSPKVRRVHCHGFEEEPTEFACDYEQLNGRHHWQSLTAFVAIDGGKWVLIDDPARRRS
ncbi:hypothetical protein [Phenylobacterium sp.]|jgi:hypothetical protein|uniref:hypothetical protein n=1 Tax=Phenylobacterium sp. TaxID=1871053 RepID=UPI002E3633BD|nr:hypothetical protein [Phenylobacterium sp.]HEX3367297.1 hypothetical protein [Phenylobacterium sp.]